MKSLSCRLLALLTITRGEACQGQSLNSLQRFVNYSRKSCIILDPGAKVIKLFTVIFYDRKKFYNIGPWLALPQTLAPDVTSVEGVVAQGLGAVAGEGERSMLSNLRARRRLHSGRTVD